MRPTFSSEKNSAGDVTPAWTLRSGSAWRSGRGPYPRRVLKPVAPTAVDSVEYAAATPEYPQPYRELGLADDEYARIREILGRRPTEAELAMYSVMWSEHCSYKSSKVHLRYFGETITEQVRHRMLAGIGENAGVVDVGDGWAVTFKVESHNHPSYVEPYQGASTGVGGIVRDILTMGAPPVCVMDSLRFRRPDAPDTARVLAGFTVPGPRIPCVDTDAEATSARVPPCDRGRTRRTGVRRADAAQPESPPGASASG